VWNCGIQSGITNVVGRSSQHLPCTAGEEVLEGTHECYIDASVTARSKLYIPRAPDQDLGSKGQAPVDVVLPKVALLKADMTYPEHPIKIVDQKDHVTRPKMVKFFKIQWSNHSKEQAMWESEDFLCSCYPKFELP
jgi:hypothetical protein